MGKRGKREKAYRINQWWLVWTGIKKEAGQIEEAAFQLCENLQSVVVEKGIVEIGGDLTVTNVTASGSSNNNANNVICGKGSYFIGGNLKIDGYKKISELTGITFEKDKTYSFQFYNPVFFREGTIGKGDFWLAVIIAFAICLFFSPIVALYPEISSSNFCTPDTTSSCFTDIIDDILAVCTSRLW